MPTASLTQPIIPTAILPAASMTPVTRPSITAITLSQTDLKEIEILDRSKNNSRLWSNKMQNYLFLKHGSRYILGMVTHPDPTSDPSSAGHWDLNNLCIIAALHTHSSSEEQEFLRAFTNAHLTWAALRS